MVNVVCMYSVVAIKYSKSCRPKYYKKKMLHLFFKTITNKYYLFPFFMYSHLRTLELNE